MPAPEEPPGDLIITPPTPSAEAHGHGSVSPCLAAPPGPPARPRVSRGSGSGPSTGRVSLSAVPTKSSRSLSYVTAIRTHHSQQVAWKQAGRREEIKYTQSLNSAPFPPCEWLGGDRLIPSRCSTLRTTLQKALQCLGQDKHQRDLEEFQIDVASTWEGDGGQRGQTAPHPCYSGFHRVLCSQGWPQNAP